MMIYIYSRCGGQGFKPLLFSWFMTNSSANVQCYVNTKRQRMDAQLICHIDLSVNQQQWTQLLCKFLAMRFLSSAHTLWCTQPLPHFYWGSNMQLPVKDILLKIERNTYCVIVFLNVDRNLVIAQPHLPDLKQLLFMDASFKDSTIIAVTNAMTYLPMKYLHLLTCLKPPGSCIRAIGYLFPSENFLTLVWKTVIIWHHIVAVRQFTAMLQYL